MVVYTLQMAKWRLAKQYNLTLVDATVKTGNVKLSPTWDMVLEYKKGLLNEEDYTTQYLNILEHSLKTHPDWWEAFLVSGDLALLCFCKAGAFCHRLLLADFIARLCEERDIPFENKGELVTLPIPPLKGALSAFVPK